MILRYRDSRRWRKSNRVKKTGVYMISVFDLEKKMGVACALVLRGSFDTKKYKERSFLGRGWVARAGAGARYIQG